MQECLQNVDQDKQLASEKHLIFSIKILIPRTTQLCISNLLGRFCNLRVHDAPCNKRYGFLTEAKNILLFRACNVE